MSEHRNIVLDLPSHPSISATARRAVRKLIGNDAPVSFVRDAVLLTSELVTNVSMHTNGACSLAASFERAAQRLRVAVTDTTVALPTLVYNNSELGGWGLRIIEKIATRWGATTTGKTVWFELEPTKL